MVPLAYSCAASVPFWTPTTLSPAVSVAITPLATTSRPGSLPKLVLRRANSPWIANWLLISKLIEPAKIGELASLALKLSSRETPLSTTEREIVWPVVLTRAARLPSKVKPSKPTRLAAPEPSNANVPGCSPAVSNKRANSTSLISSERPAPKERLSPIFPPATSKEASAESQRIR